MFWTDEKRLDSHLGVIADVRIIIPSVPSAMKGTTEQKNKEMKGSFTGNTMNGRSQMRYLCTFDNGLCNHPSCFPCTSILPHGSLPRLFWDEHEVTQRFQLLRLNFEKEPGDLLSLLLRAHWLSMSWLLPVVGLKSSFPGDTAINSKIRDTSNPLIVRLISCSISFYICHGGSRVNGVRRRIYSLRVPRDDQSEAIQAFPAVGGS
ncbi:hypothetical protein ASPWEDRAFT_480025 [Aspergillus wentii DTO 134E9]|uniref:Uncharacterized protein n=1 Tax=Aspergillus wentii DTO 134E9 TaxID=1073089 RepID=A0A1L9RIT4_ASPWE|nr:uncharacterized protein ASPWEDRAFT_480025 [Aspergillus wentii DTO 134E9]OJJ34839.1 hypothetical protein ASPWEDRAFT_480025 [Aspergillus wentii DTO 134E9]